jgi:hypothetical protein
MVGNANLHLRVFFKRTVGWTVLLIGVPFCALLFGSPPFGGSWTLWAGLFLGSTWFGLFLPFSVFAGSLSTYGGLGRARLALAAFAISVGSFSLIGFASPRLEFQVQMGLSSDMDQRFPTGPATTLGLYRLRNQVLEAPTAEFSFRVDQPLRFPPNWITYRIHSQVAVPLFAILAAFLGALTAFLTTGLSPPARRNARWAVGLVSGVLFFVAEAMGGDWVRADPLNSGVLGAWGPMFVPLLELGVLYLLLIRSRRGSTLSRGFSSSD